MKKNNSFRTAFYLGLLIIIMLVSILTLIIVNLYRSLEPKFTKDKVEVFIDSGEPVKEIIHDTVYVDKPRVKLNDTPKNITIVKPKTLPDVSEKIDTLVIVDSVK